MTREETIQGLENIESKAIDFPYMTASDWVAIAAAKRHLTNISETTEVDLEKRDIKNAFKAGYELGYERGIYKAQKGK